MKEISKIISDLKYKNYTKIRIAQELLNRGYTVGDIKIALDKSTIKTKNVNKIVGILFIVIGVLANLYTKNTYVNNYFRFDFFSQADFMLFNERVLKPVIALSIIILGVNLLLNRNNVNKYVKTFLYILLGIFIAFILSYHSYLAYIFGLVTLGLVWAIELPQQTPNPEIEKIFPYLNKKWKGSSTYIFILLGAILLYSARIEFVFVSSGENRSQASLGFIDYFLMYVKDILVYGGVLTAVLLSVNFSKFKISLYIITAIAVLIIIFSLLHTNFQNTFYGSLVILIASIISILKHKNRVKE